MIKVGEKGAGGDRRGGGVARERDLGILRRNLIQIGFRQVQTGHYSGHGGGYAVLGRKGEAGS